MTMNFFVRAIGFFNDAYDLFVMSIANVVITLQFPNEYTSSMKSAVSTSVFIGSVLGQLVFGYFADKLGRRKIMVYTALLLIGGGFSSCFAYGGSITGTLWVLIIARGILGFGIGGEYPLSCTSTAEGSTMANRGKSVSATFAMQGVGQLAAALISNILIQLLAMKEKYDAANLEIIWRTLFGLGTVPALLILYPRYKAEEPEHFVRCQEAPFKMRASFILKYYGKRLIGTAGSWFLFDIVFYSQSIFAATILSNPAFGTDHSLQMTSLKYVLLAIAALPGYFVAIFTIDRLGRQNMQLLGFSAMAVIFSILGFEFNSLKDNSLAFLILYGFTFFFSNFGPNTTTFLLPVEAFPTVLRATAHGFSAAMGKTGAIIGAAMFSPLEEKIGTGGVFIVCAVICLMSIPLTYFFVEDRTGELSLLDEELNRFLAMEDVETRERLSHSFAVTRARLSSAINIPITDVTDITEKATIFRPKDYIETITPAKVPHTTKKL